VRTQHTIRNVVRISGVGLHTGETTTLTLRPAEANSGVEFVRTDVIEKTRIPVSVDSLGERARRTTLEKDGVEVQTVEHLLAALSGLAVDNLIIEITGSEVPGMDGSSKPFADLLRSAGIVDLRVPRRRFVVETPILVKNGASTLMASPPVKSDSLSIDYTLDYHSKMVPTQNVNLTINEEEFLERIAPARTFILQSEAQQLRELGLGKGATHENTLVIGANGSVQNNRLRFEDEFVRHKVLDLIGDLFLVNADLEAHVTAIRTGHRDNVELAKRITSAMRQQENQGVLQRDTGLDIKAIMRIIPHRYPFLLIDRVIEIEGYRRAVGIKNVSINEAYFQGHWPDQPVMPGVLQIEAMAQLAGVLLYRKLENTGKTAVLLAIDHVKMRRAVVPGDQLRLEVEALRVKARTGYVVGRAMVNDKLTCEARMKFMLVDSDQRTVET
jgi:UDP-3-O-[3-hydroxymyristoyl] N-acetylglucosamine deacetylase / 3-hydroxyacyl-[acyl-carrier-protein] dehydratase